MSDHTTPPLSSLESRDVAQLKGDVENAIAVLLAKFTKLTGLTVMRVSLLEIKLSRDDPSYVIDIDAVDKISFD